MEQDKFSIKNGASLGFDMADFKRYLPSLVMLLIVGVSVFIISDKVIWLNDDVVYSSKFTESHNKLDYDYDELQLRFNDLCELIPSQNIHYNNVNGRYPVHLLVQLFCGFLGQDIFSVCNALVWIGLVLMILKLNSITFDNKFVIISIVTLLWFLMRIRMTPAYQINYIWVFLAQSSFIYLYSHPRNVKNKFTLCVLFVYSGLCGWGNECICVGVGGAIVIDWICDIKNFTRYKYIMAIGYGLGVCLLCLAPGNFVRLENVVREGGIEKICALLTGSLSYYILVSIIIYKVAKKNDSVKNIYKSNRFIFNALFISALFLLIIGTHRGRALLGVEFLSIILIVRLLDYNWFTKVILAILAMVCVVQIYKSLCRVYRVEKLYKDVICQYYVSGNGDVYIDSVVSPDKEYPYYTILPVLAEKDADRRTICSFQKKVRREHPKTGKKYIKVLPKELKNKDTIDIGNKIVSYSNGMYLLVRSKSNPARFYISRTVNLLGYRKDYEALSIDFAYPIKETDKWSAIVISESDYTIRGLSDNKVVMELASAKTHIVN